MSVDWPGLAALGFSLFPIPLREKRPAIAWKPYQERRPTAEELEEWRRGATNAAVVTGVVSGVIVLDVDSAAGEAEVQRRGMPKTPSVRTARGRHYYFKHPGFTVRNFARRLEGCDLRGDGGFVVGAGSVHPSGAVYSWETSPAEVGFADAPPWLQAMVREETAAPAPPPRHDGAAAYAEKAVDGELAALRRATVGGRNDQLNRAAYNIGTLVGAGAIDEATVQRHLLSTARAIGLAEAEAAATIKSGVAAGQLTPRVIPERREQRRRNGGSGQVLAYKAPSVPSPPPAPSALILDPRAPLDSARRFLAAKYTVADVRTLHHHQGLFWRWTGTHYCDADAAAVRAGIYDFLDGAQALPKQGDPCQFLPTRTKVNDIVDALMAAANLPADVEPPAWLDGAERPPAGEFVAMANGHLHLPSLGLWPASPHFFTPTSLPFGYDPEALDPEEWLRFLDQILGDDPGAIDALQEYCGYLLTGDTRLQKALLIHGPRRSGKGTIARVLTRLLGQDNVASPTLASLGMNFGLAPLLGKRLAVVSDARLTHRSDQAQITERLLSITGEDSVTVDRKFLPAWTGRLPVRFLLLTTELPRLADASGGLAGRFLVLPLTESFYGREDHDLTDRLLPELPQIFSWAVAGWQRLQERGRFMQPQSGRDIVEQFQDLASPIGEFVRERCVVGPAYQVKLAELFGQWCRWCDAHGRTRPGSEQTFGRDLRAVVPRLTTIRPRVGGDRVRKYEGIGLA